MQELLCEKLEKLTKRVNGCSAYEDAMTSIQHSPSKSMEVHVKLLLGGHRMIKLLLLHL